MNIHNSNTGRLPKTLLAAVSLFSIAATNIEAKQQSFERAEKELKIMSKIFDTSLSELNNTRVRRISPTRTKATYLAKQGMVFSFDFSRSRLAGHKDWDEFGDEWSAFGEDIGVFVTGIASEVGQALREEFAEPEAPEPPEEPEAYEYHFELDEEVDAEHQRLEALELMREKQRRLRDQVRKLQREIRKLERAHNRAEDENKKADSMKQELEKNVAALKAKMAEYKQSMADYRKKKAEKYAQSAKQKADTIISTLCDYGATLRSLKKDQYVSLIFSSFSKNKDQIYVFEYDDIRRCESKDKLLKSAVSYQL